MDFDISVRTIVTIALKGLKEFKYKKRDPEDVPAASTEKKPADKALPPVEATEAEGGGLIGRGLFSGPDVVINDIGIPFNYEGGQGSGDDSERSAAGEDIGSDQGEDYDSEEEEDDLDWEGKDPQESVISENSEVEEEAAAEMPDPDQTKDGLRSFREAPDIRLELDEDGQHHLRHFLDRNSVTQKDIEITELRTDY